MFQRGFNTNTVIGNLIIINILAFIASFVLGKTEVTFCDTYIHAFDTTDYWLALYLPTSDFFHPWQIVTHMFLHGGLMHLFFNMYALWMFGSVLEQVWGAKRFLIFYLVCGIGAALIYTAVKYYELQHADALARCVSEHVPVLGASGAVFGILLGFGMLFPNTELMLLFFPIPIKAKYFVIGYGVIELWMGLRNDPTDSVAHFAHIGGMIFGYILIKLWSKNQNHFY